MQVFHTILALLPELPEKNSNVENIKGADHKNGDIDST